MQRSDHRILTTHTGSLPRPPELTRLYVRRARGEAVDPAELDRLGKAALRRVVDKQIEAGIDIGNNGEQQREAFFLYVRHRMSGFGGSWKRWPRGDVERYPILKEQMAQALAAREAVGNYEPPKAIGEVRYVDDSELKAECADFRAALDEQPERVCRAVHDRAVARHHRRRDEERILRHRGGLSRRARRGAAGSNTRRSSRTGSCCSSTAPISRSNGTCPTTSGRWRISSALSSGWSRRSTARSSTSRATGCGCMSAGAITRGRTIATCRSRTSCRSCEKAKVGGFVLPFANPRHQHEWRVLQKFPLADDQIIVAGVIDDLTGFVEHPEVVADRLENVARAVGDPHRVMAGTDCGFDTSAGMGRVTEDVVWAKLKAMADGASIASQRLGLA